jgi:branched-chain amino acid transport system substrate-binding protein
MLRSNHWNAGFALCMVALVAGLGVSRAVAEISIASIAPWSTFRPDTALGLLRGTELMIESLNAAGGLLGQRLRNSQIDDGCDAVQAQAAVKLAISAHPVLVIGGACSRAAPQISKELAVAGILQILPNAAAQTMTEAGIATLLRVTARPDHEGAFVAALIAGNWAGRRVAVADDGNVNWHEAAVAVATGLRGRGLAPVLETKFRPNQPSYTEFTRELAAQRIDLLYVAGRPTDMGLIAREIAAARLTVQIVAGRNAKEEGFRQMAGSAADGILFAERRDWTGLALSDPNLAAEKARGGDLNVFLVSAYTATKVWAQAVAAAGTFDAAAVAEAAKSRRFATPLGDLAFDRKGDLTPESEAWSWYRWHDGLVEAVP